MTKSHIEGHLVRADGSAESAIPGMPAFLAPPKNAGAYHGFPLLQDSESEGFKFGAITEPNRPEPASWGDAFVEAPDGSRAGIVWQAQGNPDPVVCAPSAGRWGVYAFVFSEPIASEQDLVRSLRTVLPKLKAYYAAALSTHPESTNGGSIEPAA